MPEEAIRVRVVSTNYLDVHGYFNVNNLKGGDNVTIDWDPTENAYFINSLGGGEPSSDLHKLTEQQTRTFSLSGGTVGNATASAIKIGSYWTKQFGQGYIKAITIKERSGIPTVDDVYLQVSLSPNFEIEKTYTSTNKENITGHELEKRFNFDPYIGNISQPIYLRYVQINDNVVSQVVFPCKTYNIPDGSNDDSSFTGDKGGIYRLIPVMKFEYCRTDLEVNVANFKIGNENSNSKFYLNGGEIAIKSSNDSMSIGIGSSYSPDGANNFVIGTSATISGEMNTCLGSYSVCSGIGSTSVGTSSKAEGLGATSLRRQCKSAIRLCHCSRKQL